MKYFNYTEIEAEEVDEPAKSVKVRWLIDEKMGAPNFAMRLFEVAPGGNTPNHAHDWEHEIFVLEGRGSVLTEMGEVEIKPWDVVYVEPNEKHSIKNNGEETFKFLCLIPN
jgi:quercetin dioxygenase-like cupin family protein